VSVITLTSDFLFVGPDNGVLSFALMGAEVRDVRRLEDARHFRRPVSRTFHGRDILPQSYAVKMRPRVP